MRSRRQLVELEFRPPTTAAVLEWMGTLAAAHDGWINLLPGVPQEEEPPSRGLFSAIFGSAPAPVTMCTWMPPRAGQGPTTASIGILHPRGRYAATQLGGLGAPVPAGWRVTQDHARRGLILHPAPGAPHDDVLDWMLRSGAALAVVTLTGTWQARVYLPRDA